MSKNRSDANPYLFTQPGHHDTLPNLRLALDEGCRRVGHGLTLYQVSRDMRLVCCHTRIDTMYMHTCDMHEAYMEHATCMQHACNIHATAL